MPRNNGQSYNWSDDKEVYLLRLLDAYQCNNGGHTPDINVYKVWAEDYERQWPSIDVPCLATTLRDKRTRMRRTYTAWKALQTWTGLGYNPITDTAMCTDEQWAEFLTLHPDHNFLRYEGLKHKGLYYSVFEKYQASGSRARSARSCRRDRARAAAAIDVSAGMSQTPTYNLDADDTFVEGENVDNVADQHGVGPSTGGANIRRRKQRPTADDRLADAIDGISRYFTSKSNKTSTMDEASKTTLLGEADKIMEEMGVETEDALTTYLWLRNEKEVLKDFGRLSVEKRWGLIRRICSGRT